MTRQSSSGALVLLSGGQDSTTCLYWALQRFETVESLGFDYGQTHQVELEQASKIAEMAGVRFEILKLNGLFSQSALTHSELKLNQSHPNASNLPSTFVPGRNLLFLSIAGSAAFGRGCTDLVTGTCQTDFSGYPDCRRVFIESLETTLTLAMDRDFRIHTPLMYLDKADTFKLAEDLGVLDIILEHTHTDYNGSREVRHPWGYGNLDNDASRLRARGWELYQERYRSS